MRLTSRVEIARLAGVSPAALTKACKTFIKPAVSGKRVDADHPLVQQYIADKTKAPLPPPATGIDPLYEPALAACSMAGTFSAKFLKSALGVGTQRAERIARQIKAATTNKPIKFLKHQPPPPQNEIIIDIPDDIQAFADMTLRELVDKFGTSTRFKDWLESTKKIEDINEKRIKNAEKEGKLVSRKLMKEGVIEPIETAHLKMLTDGSKTIARRCHAMASAGRSVEDLEAFTVDQISSFIKPAKTHIARILKDA